MRTLVLSFVLVGCANLPSTLRVPSAYEERAFDAALEAWEADGRDIPACPEFDRVMVAIIEHNELQNWCPSYSSIERMGCSTGVNRYAWESPRDVIYISALADEQEYDTLLVHESFHLIRACWVHEAAGTADYLVRLHHGSQPDCQVRYPTDRNHCDRSLWGSMLSDALARLSN